jgi:simple sugar transport system permease protein
VGKKLNKAETSVFAVLLGFLLGSIILLCTGRNPLGMFASLLQAVTGLSLMDGFAFFPRNIGEFIIQVLPIALTGLSVGFAFRTGLFNIGAEGQFMIGSLSTGLVALALPIPAPFHVPLCLLAALLGGALWGAIPGLLKAYFNIHEVVVSIMMNYAGLYFSNFVILHVIGTVDQIKTKPYPRSAFLQDPFLSSISGGSRLNWGFVVAALAFVAYWFIIEKTSFGYGLRAVGFNKEAARANGMSVKRDTVLSMAIAGAFSGLGGAVVAMGTFGLNRYLPGFENYGMDGIAVALVGMNTAPGILLSALLFGMLKAGGSLMQSQSIPKEIGSIISASIVFFVALKLGLEAILAKWRSRRGAPTGPVAQTDAEENR